MAPESSKATGAMAEIATSEGSADHLEVGWHKTYWEPLTAYFAAQKAE